MSDNQKDQTQDFLDSLPELKPGETFKFACNPEVPCFNACCGDLTLMLTPYDVLRLRQALELSSRDFVQSFAEMVTGNRGFPGMQLRMTDTARRSCPFVRGAGCSLYQDRPGACRTYPLGRASRFMNGGIVEQFFIVKEPHCRGFEEDGDWSSETWLKDQGLEDYNRSNDKLMRLMTLFGETGRSLDSRQANMAFLAMYQPDDFQRFVKDMGLFKRLDLTDDEQESILASEENTLDFAMDWLELILLGTCDNLRPAQS